MERCDFSSVITIIRKYISDDRNINQVDLLYELFASFLNDETSLDFDFDHGLVCRWFHGQAKVSPRISRFYMEKSNQKSLANDIEQNVLPLMYDSAMAVQEIYSILVQDSTISDKTKNQLAQYYPCRNDSEEANFLSYVLCFGMERTFVKRDADTKQLLNMGSLSPIVKDYVYDSGVPKPCRYFCGRDKELASLHQLLRENGKVFLQGIAGIGKSELAKAYAKKYGKEYTNVLYLTYTGDLKRDITEMEFADDLPEDSDDDLFRKHNRFLRSLKEDTLFIIDNFNTTAMSDDILPIVLKYRCRILFTTRSRFDNYTFMDLEEISDTSILLELMGCFYSDAEKYSAVLEQIIQTVHSHTLAVELSARLLETGILEPVFLLNKLKEEKAALSATDTIGITKDGRSCKATYYHHIHTLFSLCQLSSGEMDIMRNLSMLPVAGISGRLFANWMNLYDMNAINDLIEKGFVQAKEGHVIALHPMMQEVAMDETKPSVRNCRTLLHSIQKICLRHGEDVSHYMQLFQTIEAVMEKVENDDMTAYLRFLEDAFPYMEKYQYVQGMELVLKELSALLEDKCVGCDCDRALLLNYHAYCEKKPEKAIKLQKEAVAVMSEITPDNALLASNLYSNLGRLYRQSGKLELAKQNMEYAIRIIEQYDLTHYHDSIVQITNYAVLMNDMGKADIGLTALKKLCRVIRECNTDKSMDYAKVQEAMGGICLSVGDIQQATTHFKKAMAVYEVLFEAEPEMIEDKKQELLGIYTQAGNFLGKGLGKGKSPLF